MSDIALKQTSTFHIFRTSAQVIGFSLLLALLAQVRIPLWFTPVPITLQTLGVMLAGAFLGKNKGTAAVALYLLQITIGLPVLAGGSVNAAALVGITGGYLVGMLFQAYFVGLWCETKASLLHTFLGLSLSAGLQLAIGTAWLGVYVGFNNAFLMGCAPFIAGELLKVSIITPVIKMIRAK